MSLNPILGEPTIDAFCSRWRVAELLLDKYVPDETDLGVSIKFDPTADWSLRDRLRMHKEFEELTGKPVRLRRTRDSIRDRRSIRVIYNA
ncbi:MAG TPA: hypothetical protein VGM92_12750 [Candidatus Kapabacteria bacterium]|jgi:hypothetical protein